MQKSLSILIVEDNPGDARLIKELLIDEGQIKGNVIVSELLSDAIEKLKIINFDIILLDLNLPDSQGFDTFKKINNIAVNIPIIILTGLVDENAAISCLKEGAQDYIHKGNFDGKFLTRAIMFAIEKKTIEKDLQQLATVLKESNDAIYCIDLNGIITLWNQGAEKIFGYKTKEMVGQHVSKITPEEYKNESDDIINLIKEGKELQSYETIRMTKDGQCINVMLSAAPINNTLNQIIGVSMVSTNITRLKLSESILAIEFRIAVALSESTDLIAAARNILNTICDIQNWQIGEIWAVNQKGNEIQCVSRWNSSTLSERTEKNSKDIFLKMGEELPGYAWQAKRPIFIPDLTQVKLKSLLLTAYPKYLTCCFGFPITFRGEILGIVLLIGHPRSEISHEIKDMFTNIGEQIGSFIKHKRLEGNLLYLSEHDSLTGLANRKYFLHSLKNEIIRCKQNNSQLAIMFLDIDFFKKINDSYGHDAGDNLLKAVANTLRQATRETDTVARFGGDEFVILLRNVDREDVIAGIALKILHLIAKVYKIYKHEFFITTSIGISVYPRDGKNADKLLKKADQAMYFVKNTGKNNYKFSYDMQSIYTKEKYQLENDLHHSLENNEMVLYYQPIVEVKNSHIIGIEALIRWQHPSGVMLSPISFIPIAIESNYIIKLGEWIINTACSQFQEWHADGLKNLSINIASPQLNTELVQMLKKIIIRNNIDPKKIILEITEQILMSNNEQNMKLIKELKNLNIQVAIDDFGIGYSSFIYLKTFQMDFIKIDQSFVKDLPYNGSSAAIVNAILAIAKAMNVQVIAEGVETDAQFQFLKERGCDFIQGFYFSKPLPADELIKLLNSQEYLYN